MNHSVVSRRRLALLPAGVVFGLVACGGAQDNVVARAATPTRSEELIPTATSSPTPLEVPTSTPTRLPSCAPTPLAPCTICAPTPIPFNSQCVAYGTIECTPDPNQVDCYRCACCAFESVGDCCDFGGRQPCHIIQPGEGDGFCRNAGGSVVGCPLGAGICSSLTGRCELH